MCSLDGQYFKLRLFVHTDLSTKCTPPYLHIISTPTLPKLSSPAVHSKPPSTKHTLSKSPIATHPLQHTHPHTLIMSNTVSYLNGDTLIMDARKDSSGMIQVMAKNCRTFIFSGLSGDIIISMKSLRTKIKKRKKKNVIMSTWNDKVMAKNCSTFIFSGLSGDIIISMKSLETKIKKRKKEECHYVNLE